MTEGRCDIEDDGAELRIKMPVYRNWLAVVVYPVWLAVWSHGLLDGALRFDVGWLVMWAIGTAWVGGLWLWMVFGREIVTVHRGELSRQRILLGMGITGTYDDVVDIHSVDNTVPWWSKSWPQGAFALETPKRTIRFGEGLDQWEAGRLVPLIRSRLRQPVVDF